MLIFPFTEELIFCLQSAQGRYQLKTIPHKISLPLLPSSRFLSFLFVLSLLHHPIPPLLGMEGRASCMVICSESFNLPLRPRLAVDRVVFSLSGLDVILGAVQVFKALPFPLLLVHAHPPFPTTGFLFSLEQWWESQW